MPISKYNPDGTVDIYNSKTGEVRSAVSPGELGAISPRLVAEYQQGQTVESRASRAQAEEAIKNVESPELKDPFAAQKKSALQSLDILENRYKRDGSGELGGKGDLSLAGEGGLASRDLASARTTASNFVTGELIQDINKFKGALDTFRGTFTQAFGSGTPQEAEAQALLKAAPDERSTNAEAKAWFDDVKALLSGGRKEEGETSLPTFSQVEPGAEADIQVAREVSGEPPQGIVPNILAAVRGEETGGFSDIFPTERLINDENRNKMADLWLQANPDMTEEKAMELANETADFAESAGASFALRGDLQAINPSSAIGAVGAVDDVSAAVNKSKEAMIGEGGIVNRIVKIGEGIENNTPRAVLGRLQEQAAKLYKGVKPEIKNIIQAGEDLAESDPNIAKEFAKQKSFLENIDSIPKLVKRMQTWGRNTYKSSGGIRSGATKDLYDGFYKEGLKILKEQAPEVYKYRSLLRFSYELPTAASKLLWKATLGRIVTGF